MGEDISQQRKHGCGNSATEGSINPIDRLALGDIIRRSARRFSDKGAILEEGRITTYRQLDERSDQLAQWLLSIGLSEKAKIATICKNSAAYVTAIFGVNKSGFVWVPINVVLGPLDVCFILEHCEAELVLVDLHCMKVHGEALRKLNIRTLVIDPDSDAPFGDEVASHPATSVTASTGDRDCAFVMYTSGTTAKPKGVMHSHQAAYVALLSNIGEWSVTRDDRILMALPLFHIAGHTMVTTLLAAGGSVVLHEGFDPAKMAEAIAEEQVTMLFALPMMYAAMLEAKRRTGASTASLRFCIYAMAPMPRTLIERLVAEFCPTFALTSGQTEIYPMTVMFRPEHQLIKFGTYWGESAGINDTEVMDDDGHILPAGEIGEIVHRGPNVMLGYFKDPEATEKARQYGWHHTGDLGYFDADGQLVFTDRKKDIIKSGGENIPSVLVEEALLQHPSVKQVAVIGVPHPKWTEAVLACVVLHPGESLHSDALIEHARQRLGAFQVPKGLAFIDSLPLTATGKPIKSELRRMYRAYFNEKPA